MTHSTFSPSSSQQQSPAYSDGSDIEENNDHTIPGRHPSNTRDNRHDSNSRLQPPPRPELSQHRTRPGTSRKPCRVKRLPSVTPWKILDPHCPDLLPLFLACGRKGIAPSSEAL